MTDLLQQASSAAFRLSLKDKSPDITQAMDVLRALTVALRKGDEGLLRALARPATTALAEATEAAELAGTFDGLDPTGPQFRTRGGREKLGDYLVEVAEISAIRADNRARAVAEARRQSEPVDSVKEFVDCVVLLARRGDFEDVDPDVLRERLTAAFRDGPSKDSERDARKIARALGEHRPDDLINAAKDKRAKRKGLRTT